jgi:hypothetical protein
LDDTQLDGLPEDIAYMDARLVGLRRIAEACDERHDDHSFAIAAHAIGRDRTVACECSPLFPSHYVLLSSLLEHCTTTSRTY